MDQRTGKCIGKSSYQQTGSIEDPDTAGSRICLSKSIWKYQESNAAILSGQLLSYRI